jgi:hypothetical protein
MPSKGQLLSLLALIFIVTAGAHRESDFPGRSVVFPAVATGPGLDLDSLVVVTDDLYPWGNVGGCDGISVFDVESSAPVHRGRTLDSPGRLAATSDLSTLLAISSNFSLPRPRPFLYLAHRDPANERRWTDESRIYGADFEPSGGIAIAPDDDTLLAATDADVSPRGVTARGPYAVEKYSLSEIAGVELGPRQGVLLVPGRVAEILPTPDGHFAHLFTTRGDVLTIDIATMRETAPMVHAAPLVLGGTDAALIPAAYGHASVSPDGRFLVTNRWGAPQLNVVDLVARTATTVTVPFQPTGGVAFNYDPGSTGLLAVHGLRRVGVFRFDPPGHVGEVGRTSVAPPRIPALDSVQGGPYASIAWSANGGYLIAAIESGLDDFQVFRVAETTGGLVTARTWAACIVAQNDWANDVLTLNRPRLPTPTVTATDGPPPTETPSPTATATPEATWTNSPTAAPTGTTSSSPTPTPTPTSTRPPSPVYLPLALRERCIPGKQRLDVALVIDASTTMRDDRTATGRTKLEAATEAARALVDTLALPLDQAAVVTFSSDATLLVGLTGRRSEIEAALDRIAVGRQTRIDRGIAVAHEELTGPRRRPGSAAVMVVLTDGLANPEPASTAVARAGEAKGDGITIFTIGLGRDADLDVGALEQMASRREYGYRAPDGEDLLAIYGAIAVEIPCPAERYWGRR